MAIEHVDIADGERHEPKGAATAAINTVYVSDGAASGTWKFPSECVVIELDDISTASSSYVAMPYAGTVDIIYSVIHGAITGTDVTLTCKINGTDITTGALTVAYTGSAAGDVDTVTPTAANAFTAGQYLEVATGGGTGAVRATITFLVTRTS